MEMFLAPFLMVYIFRNLFVLPECVLMMIIQQLKPYFLIQAHWGLPVGFLLLRYSVLFTVESLYLLYLLVISGFI